MDGDAFVQGFLDLVVVSGHLLALLQADQRDLLLSQADSRSGHVQGRRHGVVGFLVGGRIDADRPACHVDGHVAAPDDHHPRAQLHPVAEIDVQEKLDSP